MAEAQGEMTSQPCVGLTVTSVDNPGGSRVAPCPPTDALEWLSSLGTLREERADAQHCPRLVRR